MINGVSSTLLDEGATQNSRQTFRPGRKKKKQITNPTVKALIENFGFPSQEAQIVVGYAAILMKTVIQQNSESGREITKLGKALENLLKTDFTYRSGVAHRLSRATGLTVDEAAFGLEKAVTLLNEQWNIN
ncbi:MAG: hypothetical protein DWQ04_22605 [Chloroflexi bacterium]|nr:MAG: hypothetical protein DWQ04_22605 [Chloroflexota bacterium]